eukprot:1160742-Pelagomonas_calceolata.AAC.2
MEHPCFSHQCAVNAGPQHAQLHTTGQGPAQANTTKWSIPAFHVTVHLMQGHNKRSCTPLGRVQLRLIQLCDIAALHGLAQSSEAGVLTANQPGVEAAKDVVPVGAAVAEGNSLAGGPTGARAAWLSPDVIVCDPARAGLSSAVVDYLRTSTARSYEAIEGPPRVRDGRGGIDFCMVKQCQQFPPAGHPTSSSVDVKCETSNGFLPAFGLTLKSQFKYWLLLAADAAEADCANADSDADGLASFGFAVSAAVAESTPHH